MSVRPHKRDPLLTMRQWQRVRLGLRIAYRGEPSVSSGTFSSRGLIVWRVDCGQVEVRTDFGHFSAGPGEWMLHCTARRFQSFVAGTRIRSAQIDLEWPSGSNVLTGSTPVGLSHREAAKIAPAMNELLALGTKEQRGIFLVPDQIGPFVGELQIRAAVDRFTALAVTEGLRRGWQIHDESDLDTRVGRMLTLLDALPLAERFDKARLAQSVGLGPTHVNRLFLQSQGLTPNRYFDQRRLDFACDHLATGDLSIKEIASALGFSSLQHFSAWFRKRHGISPRGLRRSM